MSKSLNTALGTCGLVLCFHEVTNMFGNSSRTSLYETLWLKSHYEIWLIIINTIYMISLLSYLSVYCTWNECSMCNNVFLRGFRHCHCFFMFGGRMLPPLSQLSAMQLLLLFTYYCDSAPTSQIKLVRSDGCCMLQLFLFPWWSI